MVTERITEIPDIADALCDGYRHIERIPFWDKNRHRQIREHPVTLPGLLGQMRELFEPSADPDSGSPAAVSKPPARWDALAEHTQITIAVFRWLHELDMPSRVTVEDNIRALVGAAPAMAFDRRQELRREMQLWLRWAETVTGWRTPPIDPRAPCPALVEDELGEKGECGARTLRINLTEQAAYCGTCGTLWEGQTALAALGEILKGYHRLREAEAKAARLRARAKAVEERRAREGTAA